MHINPYNYTYVYIYIYICIVCHVIQAQASLQVTCNAATHSCLHTYNTMQLLPWSIYTFIYWFSSDACTSYILYIYLAHCLGSLRRQNNCMHVQTVPCDGKYFSVAHNLRQVGSSVTTSSVRLEWDAPDPPNGNIMFFKVTYQTQRIVNVVMVTMS